MEMHGVIVTLGIEFHSHFDDSQARVAACIMPTSDPDLSVPLRDGRLLIIFKVTLWPAVAPRDRQLRPSR